MALNSQNRLAVAGSAAEALKLTWALLLPYVILTLVLSLPFVTANGLGLLDSLYEFPRQIQDLPDSEILDHFPLGEILLSLVLGFVVLSSFGIFWYRYLLLGPRNALKFGFVELNSMVWQFSGYGLLIMVVWLVAFSIATLLGCLLGVFVSGLLGQSGTSDSYLIMFAFVILAYVWPLKFAVRTALIFPAIAVGRPIALREAWTRSKDSANNLIWTLLIVGAPPMLLSWGTQYTLSTILGIDLLPQTGFTGAGLWWIDVLLSPLGNLSLATTFGVVAIAYRDLLNRTHAPETAPAFAGRNAEV